MRDSGGRIRVRLTIAGTPLASSSETTASPVPTSRIAVSVSKAGLGRKVSAACFSALASRGVKARSACWTRLPSWARTSPGTSSGFWVQK